MPELPEVETIVNDLNKEIKGNIISDVLVFNQRTFKNYSPKTRELIKNSKIEKFERRGKYIIFHLKKANNPRALRAELSSYDGENSFLITHLKMTGNFSILKSADLGAIKNIKHARAVFILKSKDALIFKDIRKFGKIYFENKNSSDDLEITKKLGPDALLNLNLKEFENNISKRKTKIKPLLLNQEFIAGLGNIYADESLWASKIHPLTPANKLSKKQIKTLFNSIQKILKTAVALRGSSMRDYKDLMGKDGGYIKIRKVYMRECLPCFRCKAKIVKIKIGQRSAHFCPKCQRI